MEVYFLRHADAESSEPGKPDAERRLTDKGRRQTAAVSRYLVEQGIRVALVLSSPHARAAETAQPVAESLGVDLATDDRLAAGRLGVAQLAAILRELVGPGAVLIVGHEPDISGTIAELIGGGEVEVKKAALALVSGPAISRGHCVLSMLVPCGLMR